MQRQHGQALLFLVVTLAIGAVAVFYTYISPSSASIRIEQITAAALAQAREALIGRAAADGDRPGSLPCPDTDNDGLENWDVTATYCASDMGRLPWMTLGLPDLRDGSGERLWYALSPDFRDNTGALPLNSDRPGQFTITGTSPASNVIAILFAPGAPLASQNRSAANQNNATHYLEGENNNGDMTFTMGYPSTTFNDRLMVLSSDALFAAVTARVAREVQRALDQYRADNGYYPDANDYADGPPYFCTPGLAQGRIPLAIQAGCPALVEWTTQLPLWFTDNHWNRVTHYAVDNKCAITVTGHTTAACAVVIVSGRAMGAQARPCANAADCMEDAENINGNNVYVKPSRYPTSNDRMAVSCGAISPCAAVP